MIFCLMSIEFQFCKMKKNCGDWLHNNGLDDHHTVKCESSKIVLNMYDEGMPPISIFLHSQFHDSLLES